MREIKFRFWNGEEMRFAEIRELSWGVLSGVSDINCPGFSGGIDVDIMQYTGLKDKNGTEIYEGDIVSGDFTLKYEVIFDKCEFRIGYDGIYKYKNSLEVIGNIYQNPELLNN